MAEQKAVTDSIAAAFFDRFVEVFSTFSGSHVADLFAAPGVALRRDGTLVPLTTREDVIRYYQAALDHYQREGCRGCRWLALDVTPMGTAALLATVNWELLREDGSILTGWRQSYCLNLLGGEAKVFASAMHPAGPDPTLP
jgi:hypothetical protein